MADYYQSVRFEYVIVSLVQRVVVRSRASPVCMSKYPWQDHMATMQCVHACVCVYDRVSD